MGQSGAVNVELRVLGSWFRLLLLGSSAVMCGPRSLLTQPLRPAARSAESELAAAQSRSEAQPSSSAPVVGDAWAAASGSPSPALALLRIPGCASQEQSLLAAARAVANAVAQQRAWDVSDVVAWLRAAGGPFVWPRVWTLQGATFDAPQVHASLEQWLVRVPQVGRGRCGAAEVVGAAGSHSLAVVVVDVLADLDPLPTRVRLGQWLRLRARLLVPTHSAETVLLGPRGDPRTIPSELRPDEVRSVFSLDQAGMWRIQLLLGTETGPRPVAEAWTFVDDEPNLSAARAPAPGEALSAQVVPGATTTEEAQRNLLLEMLNAARRSEQRMPARRDLRLDQLAQAHAEGMRRTQQTAHDVGQGLPSERLHRAGISAALVGENVAHAASLGRAHRALWDSPAHRGTLLEAGFSSVGLGVAAEGTAVWVCELFTN
jgi:uncharacterized protein YkwD